MRSRSRRAEVGAPSGQLGPVVRRALLRFGVASLLALLVVALGSVLMSRRIAREEAVRDATVSTESIARTLVAPRLERALRAGEPAARTRMTELMRVSLREASLEHVTIWDRSGRVLWADDRGLVGRTFTLPRPVVALFGTNGSVAEASDPTPGGDPADADLLHVYADAADSHGRPFVLETSTSRSHLARNTHVIFVELVPIGVAALLLFSLATVPFAVALARHVDRGHRHRAELLRHSVAAWDLERRRIAQDLHDGPVQHLAAVGYTLGILVERLPDAESRRIGLRLTELMQTAVTDMRGMVGSLVPAEPVDESLAAAIAELASLIRDQGVEVVVDVAPDVRLDPDIARIAYRVTREGLRNVVKHAGASTARVTIRAGDDRRVDVRVIDDGQGLPPGPSDGDRHMGLDLLAATVREAGGDLVVETAPGGGVVLAASLPVDVDG